MGEKRHVTALIVAAGRGERAGQPGPKQYAVVGGKAVLAHAIDALAAVTDRVRVVIHAGDRALYDAAIGTRVIDPPVIGGGTRRESVLNGLDALVRDGMGGLVLIHDAARPFPPAAMLRRLIEALDDAEGAVPVLPLADTLVEAGHALGDVVDRNRLSRVQTPQAFTLHGIFNAHRAWDVQREATDDAQIARAVGMKVVTVAGDEAAAKLTYPADFAAVEARLRASLVSRTGSGFDVHRFGPGDSLWLCGVNITHDRGLIGHSDADVGLHALTDALLGALGDGDIGSHFPPSDPQWRGAASHRFLAHARDLVSAAGGIIDHVDVTIIAEAPKVGPHRDAMRRSIAGTLQIPLGRVSVKATTTEKLGFTGRGEGIAAQAMATVRLPESLE